MITSSDLEELGYERFRGKLKTWYNPKTYLGIQLWKDIHIFSKVGMFDREEQIFRGSIKDKKELKVVLKMIGYERG